MGRTGGNSPPVELSRSASWGTDLPFPKGALGSLPRPRNCQTNLHLLNKGPRQTSSRSRPPPPPTPSLSSSLLVPNWNTWPPRWPPLKIGVPPGWRPGLRGDRCGRSSVHQLHLRGSCAAGGGEARGGGRGLRHGPATAQPSSALRASPCRRCRHRQAPGRSANRAAGMRAPAPARPTLRPPPASRTLA